MKVKPPIRVTQNPDLHAIGNVAFENLCRDLYSHEPDVIQCDRYGVRGQTQYGVDLIAYLRESPKVDVCQCKCYASFGPNQIKKASDAFLENWSDYWANRQVKRFILFVACDLTEVKTQERIYKEKARFETYGLQYEAWSASTIVNKMRPHQGLVASHLDASWIEILCGPTDTRFRVENAAMLYQNEQMATFLAGSTEDQLNHMRVLWREGKREEAAVWLKKIRSENTLWPTLPASLRAKLLRFEATIALVGSNFPEAERAAAEAAVLSPSVDDNRLTAAVALHKGDVLESVSLLQDATDIESIHLRAFLLAVVYKIADRFRGKLWRMKYLEGDSCMT